MPETGQPGGAGGHRSGSTQAGRMALGSKGPFIKTLVLPTKAGDTTLYIKCPLGVRWNVLAIAFAVATDATVKDRYVMVDVLTSDGLNVERLVESAGIAASTTFTYFAGPSENDNTTLYFPMALVDGMQLFLRLSAGVAGDTWQANITVMEWKI